MTSGTPLVTVLMAAHDAEAYLRPALDSMLGQTVRDLELLVVDDGSTDATPDILASVDDPRLVVLRNETRSGLAASLDRGVAAARGRWVARLDADDVALPHRLERQLMVARGRGSAIVGSAVADIDSLGEVTRAHAVPVTDGAIRWHALFSSPFYHPTVLLDRELLDQHGLHYDTTFAESEDYDLWSRLLAVGSGANVNEPLVLYRVHPAQATRRRRDLQRAFQRTVALRAIAAVAPRLSEQDADWAWRLGAGEPVNEGEREAAVASFLSLVEAFAERHPGDGARAARRAAARTVARVAREAGVGSFAGRAFALDPLLVPHAIGRRVWRRRALRKLRYATSPARPTASSTGLGRVRVTVVSPEPTPFRSLMFDRLANREEIDFSVLYSARTVFSRTWTIEHHYPHRFLGGLRIPGVRRVFRHDYVITPSLFRELRAARPDVVVISGWSTFASQAAALWCARHRVPYVLLVESNDRDRRPGWRRLAKRLTADRLVRHAEHILVVGTLAAESVLARGADPARMGRFANTVDVDAFRAHDERLAPARPNLRAALGVAPDDVLVVSIARLAPEKGLETLVRAVAAVGDQRIVVAVAGEGPLRERLEWLARELDVRLILLGDLQPWERVFDVYAAADVFALLSTHEPWGVVVNEAAAFGLPLLLSDRVGAAFDLLVDGDNGALVPAGDVAAASSALRALALDPVLRRLQGDRSRALMQDWGYEPSLDAFVEAVRLAARR